MFVFLQLNLSYVTFQRITEIVDIKQYNLVDKMTLLIKMIWVEFYLTKLTDTKMQGRQSTKDVKVN